ncbi:hypothetical protein B0H14DRAFT_3447653 [Mycena olivaceomarginata]|nr:hypothetical protein B0H14DRAFT_3447653 [Mycena olivaceomarginata]
MLRLLDSILAHLARFFSTTPSISTPLPAPEDQSWYVNVLGCHLARQNSAVQRPCLRMRDPCPAPNLLGAYFRHRCSIPTPAAGVFETAFGFGSEDPELFFVVDWDPHVYYDSYAAENAWRHQGEKKSAVFVTLSWNDAWARAQRWTTDYSGD